MSKIDIAAEIGDFLRLLDQAQKDYAWYKDELHRLEQLQQDYLHMLELQDATYHKRAKIASELRQCRIDRREAKDTIAILDPLVDFLQSDRGKILISQLQQILGCIRKATKNTQIRKYTPRVLSLEEYNSTE